MEESTTSKNVSPALILSVVVIVAVIGFMMYRASTQTTNPQVEQETPATQPTTAMEASPTTPETTGSAMMEAEVRTVNVEAGSFYFNPKEIRVKKGEKIKIVLTAKDMMHDFTIDELGVKSPVAKAGETVMVEFTADKTGTYEYYCSVGNHRQQGQVGTLIVE
jgi:nitrosocyanin